MNNNYLMVKPEFRFLIDREDGEILPLIDSHLFTAFVMVVGLNMVLILGFLISLDVGRLVFKGLTKLWSLLTPGNQWQELFLIGSSIFLGTLMLLIINEIFKKLDEAFTKLNNQLKEKNARIVALESKLDLKEREFLLKSDESESGGVRGTPVESDESESGGVRGTPVESDESESDESWGAKPVESDEIKTHINNLLTTKYIIRNPTINRAYNNDEEE
jgi:hypothetical protein